MNKTSRSVVTDFRLALRFEEVRTRLTERAIGDVLERPLAFFASPSDRHLPLALINRSLRELIGSPLADLQSVPGIGPKKLNSLIDLLERAVPQEDAERSLPVLEEPPPQPAVASAARSAPLEEEPAVLATEAVWQQWRAAIRNHHLGRETLGRFAPSLRRLPRTLWAARLEGYLDLSLQELRSRRNHGEKRVAAILEIIGGLYKLLLRLDEHSHLSVYLLPRFATTLDRWLTFRLRHPELPGLDEVNSAFVAPLIDQLGVDGGEAHVGLVKDRLNSSSRGIGHAARRLGLARGRAYEMLGDAQAIMEVRWPEGTSRVAALLNRMRREAESSEATTRLAAAAGLFFRDLPYPSAQAKAGSATADSDRLFQTAVFCAT